MKNTFSSFHFDLKGKDFNGYWNYSFHFRINLSVYIILGLLFSIINAVHAQKFILDQNMHHLRLGDKQEWADLPLQAEGKELLIPFVVQNINEIQTLQVRQQDVRQEWRVKINDHYIGRLDRDEKDKIIYLNIPPGVIHSGDNRVLIQQSDSVPDDIWVGQVVLLDQPTPEVLFEASLHVEVVDGDSNTLLPSRITVTNAEGALQTVGFKPSEHLAIRPGFIYTGNGKASFGLPSGRYTVYASRGFEYGVDSIQVDLKPGNQVHKKFIINREVPTAGWISSDTHIHTFTHSGHGDATMEERVLTIAGEGIELPIITDHNVHVDINPVAKAMQVHSYFTPIIGNEVTTRIGHFNIFPVSAGAPVPDIQVEDWATVSQNIGKAVNHGAIILNHARDNHGGFRPFGEERHIAVAGLNLRDWKVPANAMEVVNSGAQQTDMMRLYHDWFGMLNRGYFMTPVGASDSHDVSRYLVGQARTYIRSQNEDPAKIDVNEAVKNFRDGKVMVSFGLLAEMVVNSKYGPGDVVPASDDIVVSVRVLGPSWVRANHISLYANGQKIREEAITAERESSEGVKWTGTWTLPRPNQDIFLVAVARGPGTSAPFWQIAKPYQPVSPLWVPSVIGSTGAVWIDADGDGHRTTAFAYAEELLKESEGNIDRLVKNLVPYDEAVAVQAAALLMEKGRLLKWTDMKKSLQQAAPATRSGFLKFTEAWQVSGNIP